MFNINTKKPSLIASNGDSFGVSENEHVTLGGASCNVPLKDITENNVVWAKGTFSNDEFAINMVSPTQEWLLNGMIVVGSSVLKHGDKVVLEGTAFGCNFKPNTWQSVSFRILFLAGFIVAAPMIYQYKLNLNWDNILQQIVSNVKQTKLERALTFCENLKRLEHTMLVDIAPDKTKQFLKNYKTICVQNRDSIKLLAEFYAYAMDKTTNPSQREICMNNLHQYRFLKNVLTAIDLFEDGKYDAINLLLESTDEFTEQNVEGYAIYMAILQSLPNVGKKVENEKALWLEEAVILANENGLTVLGKRLYNLISEVNLNSNPPVPADTD